jgi:hypothetical protein
VTSGIFLKKPRFSRSRITGLYDLRGSMAKNFSKKISRVIKKAKALLAFAFFMTLEIWKTSDF